MKPCTLSATLVAVALVSVASVAVPQEPYHYPVQEKACELALYLPPELHVPLQLQGHCEFFRSRKDCAKGLTMPVSEDICPKEFDLPVPCCLEQQVNCVEPGGLKGVCMNKSKGCGGEFRESYDCPQRDDDDIQCCVPPENEIFIDGESPSDDAINIVVGESGKEGPLAGMNILQPSATVSGSLDANNGPVQAAPLAYGPVWDSSSRQQAPSGGVELAAAGELGSGSTNWV